MGDLTRNISRHEVACKCGCGQDNIDFATICMIQEACDYFSDKLGEKVTLLISSACRCKEHNRHEGGAKDSYHLVGRAIDHRIKEVAIRELHRYYCERYPGRYGIALYVNKSPSFVHLDSRSGRPWRAEFK